MKKFEVGLTVTEIKPNGERKVRLAGNNMTVIAGAIRLLQLDEDGNVLATLMTVT